MPNGGNRRSAWRASFPVRGMPEHDYTADFDGDPMKEEEADERAERWMQGIADGPDV